VAALTVTAALAALVLAPSASTVAAAAPGCAAPTLTPAEVGGCLAAGGLDVHDVTITGSLDLRGVGTVDAGVRCQRCRIEGDLVVTGVTFARAVELDDVTVTGSVRAADARFVDVLLVRSTRDAGAVVQGDLELDRADFADTASFDGLTVHGRTSIVSARFARAASFRGVQLDGAFDAEQASFGAGLQFTGDRPVASGSSGNAAAAGPVSLRGAHVAGPIDVRDRTFTSTLDGRGAAFDGSALFTTVFLGDVDLTGASFGDLDAHSAHFAHALILTSAHLTSLDLSAGVSVGELFLGSVRVTKQASLAGIEVNGAVDVDDLRAGSLVMDIDLLAHARSRQALLDSYSQVESTARAAGDSKLANEAHYRRLALAGRQGSWLHQATDFVFYRGVMGYLVRPLHPATTILLVVVLGAIARGWYDRIQRRRVPVRSSPRTERPLRPSVRAGRAVAAGFNRFSRALGSTLRPKPAIPSPAGQNHFGPYAVAAGRWTEFLVGKVLLFLFVVCLGNANATLHDLFQSLRG
jgi:uncharacterized protein YjbI with pentapeptide repeats